MKTTKKHFKLFQDECIKWLKFFGLKGWEIYFHHDLLLDAYAETDFNITNRICQFRLTTDWGDEIELTDYQIKRTAFHEVAELLLARLRVLGLTRSIGETDIDEEVHQIVRTLENVLFTRQQKTWFN